ncbi:MULTISPECIES: TlpA family protein disulfide reductase [Butyricimonas]|uniref:TlpA family protein disulfide reductase n=1 Tax=Butyricimonas TaxID=574697 RepID=UPI0007FB439E|nr:MULTISPECIES: TlpA disulfide reductase family protein [Butyricimonas]
MTSKFIILAMAFIALVSCNKTSQTSVKFHVEDNQTYPEAVLMTKDSIYKQSLDPANSTTFTLMEKFEPAYGAMFFGQRHVILYLEPGKSFDLSVKIEGRNAIPTFTGDGAKKNQYLNHTDFSFTPDYKLNETEFAASLDKQLEKLYKNLESQDFDEYFNNLEKKRLKYSVFSYLLEYRSAHLYAIENFEYKLDQAYFDKLAEVFTEDEDMLGMGVYQEYMKKMVSYLAINNMPEFEDFQYIKEQLNYVNRHFKNPAVAEFIVDCIISEYISRNGIHSLQELAPIYKAKVNDPKKLAAFNALCDKWRRIAPGEPSPSFTYKDIDGKEVHLSDFAGKYVYIDNWATWCGPCRREQPALKKLEERYAGKNICFISVSCDQDKSAWEKMVKEEKLEGIHLYAGAFDSFMDAYMVTAIPHFILIDREGKIINPKMSRPSDPETVKFLDALEGL